MDLHVSYSDEEETGPPLIEPLPDITDLTQRTHHGDDSPQADNELVQVAHDPTKDSQSKFKVTPSALEINGYTEPSDIPAPPDNSGLSCSTDSTVFPKAWEKEYREHAGLGESYSRGHAADLQSSTSTIYSQPHGDERSAAGSTIGEADPWDPNRIAPPWGRQNSNESSHYSSPAPSEGHTVNSDVVLGNNTAWEIDDSALPIGASAATTAQMFAHNAMTAGFPPPVGDAEVKHILEPVPEVVPNPGAEEAPMMHPLVNGTTTPDARAIWERAGGVWDSRARRRSSSSSQGIASSTMSVNSTASVPIISHGMPPSDIGPYPGGKKHKPFLASITDLLKFPHHGFRLKKDNQKPSSSCSDVPNSSWADGKPRPKIRRSSSLEQKLMAITKSNGNDIKISPEDLSPVEVVGFEVRPRCASDAVSRCPVKKSVMIADPSTTRVTTFEVDEEERLRSPRSPLESDDSYYDTVSSTCSTASLLRKAVKDKDSDVLIDNDSHPAVYDTISSTSSGAALLKDGMEAHILNTHIELPSVLVEAAEDIAGDEYVDLVQSGGTGPGLGQALLAKTLDHVKQSLEELSPSLRGTREDVRPVEKIDKLKNAYIKNLIVLSIGFMLTYTAFFSLRNLQSSINHDGGLGLFSMSAMYVTFVIGCVFATSVVYKCRPKHAIVISMLGMLVYIVAQFYPTMYTLIPSAALLGFAMAVMWTAQGSYITSIAITYATAADMNHVGVLGLFNGFFLFLIQVAQILGNLVSSAIFNIELSYAHEQPGLLYANTTMPSTTESHVTTFDAREICGARYCQHYRIAHAGADVQRHMVYILLGVFTACTFVGILILAFALDKLDIIFRKRTNLSVSRQLLALFHLHGNKKLICLLPLTIYLGMEEAYMFGEFTKGFITCPFGLHMIGYVMMCFGACDALSSFFFGNMQKYVHRSAIIAIAAVTNTSLMITMYLWPPDPGKAYVVFLLAGLWGVADGIWQTQLCSMSGLLFANQREAAFASLRMYESLGFVIAFAYAQFICLDIKIIITGVLLVFGLIGYVMMEIIHKRTYVKEAHVSFV